MGENSTLEYVLGAIAGVIFGGAAGAGKYFLLWRRFMDPEYRPDPKKTAKLLYRNMALSNIINILTLFVVFLIRNIIPFDFVAMIIATALALSISNRVFPINKAMRTVGEQNSVG